MRTLALIVFASGCQLVFDVNPSTPGDGAPTGDGPTDAAATHKLVFVTKKVTSAAFGGLDGADGICQLEAKSLERGTFFKAWLSSVGKPVKDRMMKHDLPYQLISGTVIATKFGELLDGNLQAPIDETQFGDRPTETSTACNNGTGVWTNTTILGEATGPDDCAGWTSSDTSTSNAGSSAFDDTNWTDDPGCRSITCNNGFSLYCVEQ